MKNYTAFAKVENEINANLVCSSLERMSTRPSGVGVLEIEDGSGIWEVSGFFLKKPNYLELKILEVVYETEFIVSKIVNKDWMAKVQRDLTPVSAGRFMLFGNHDKDKIPINVVGLKIEAAMAFGTGHHATTVGCLLALEYLIKMGHFFQNIADIGCGTGVLAMAAARIFKANVIATDIDEVAVETARANFRANGLNTKITLVCAPGFNKVEIVNRAPFDLVFANILANPLCLLAPSMVKHIQKNGLIILSGILNRQAKRVEGYYITNGFYRVRVQKIGQWTTIIMQRK